MLDIGYGNGFLLQRLDRRFKPELYGIDISEDMLLAAEKRNRKAKEAGSLKIHLFMMIHQILVMERDCIHKDCGLQRSVVWNIPQTTKAVR